MHAGLPPSTRARRVVCVALLTLMGGGLLAGCSDDSPSVNADATTTSSTEATTTTVAAATGSGSNSGSNSGGKSGGSSSGGSGSGQSGGGQSGGAAAPAAVITTFETPENIDCHNGNQQNFTATWTTTNATKVTISMDGALYKTYGPNGEASLPFNCSSGHTYVLTAYNADNKTTTKSITLQPRNVQPPSGDEEQP